MQQIVPSRPLSCKDTPRGIVRYRCLQAGPVRCGGPRRGREARDLPFQTTWSRIAAVAAKAGEKLVLDERRIQRIKKQLEDERVRLQRELCTLSTPMDERERPGYGTHMADDATDVFEQARNLAVHQRLQRTLDDVNRALEKMDNGTYRVCDRCGGAIDPARLKALQHATLCKSCQARLEAAPRRR